MINNLRLRLREIEDAISLRQGIYDELMERYQSAADIMAYVEGEKIRNEVSFLEGERERLLRQINAELEKYRQLLPEHREAFRSAVDGQQKLLKTLLNECRKLDKFIALLEDFEASTNVVVEEAREYFEVCKMLGVDAESRHFTKDGLRDLRLELMYILTQLRRRIEPHIE